MSKLSKFIMCLGVLNIVLGFTYILPIYGEMESEVSLWGILSVCLGITFIVYSRKYVIKKGAQNSLLLGMLISLLLLNVFIQILPIYLWFEFHGRKINDGIPDSQFTAHYLFSIPHIISFIFGLISIVWIIVEKLISQKTQESE